VDARLIVVASESGELALKIQSVPEPEVVQILSPHGADQPFDERVRAGHEGYGLDFLNFEYPQVRSPAMASEQRIVVRTQMLRERLTRSGLVEHATDRHAIDVSRLDANADDPTREQIHDDHDPVALEHNRFASEQIDAPQAVFHVSDEREPGGSLISGARSEMPSEDAAHDIFVDLDAKRVSNLLGNSRTPEARIAALHFEDRRDEFLRGRNVQQQNRHSLCCCAMVVAEHPAKALAPLNGVMGQGGGGYGLQEWVFDSLMITFDMVVQHELPDCVLKRRLSEEDHPA
jgi:hypothetical protein